MRWPITSDQILRMLDAFKHGRVMHYRYAADIVGRVTALFNREPTVQEITVPETHKLTVVGDTHGQLQDLFTIFTINGLPSESNMVRAPRPAPALHPLRSLTHLFQYLFNGDFVDRGPNGMEILLTIFAYKLLFPKFVFLNRGNHESRGQNSWMGFEDEVLRKYHSPDDPVQARRFYEQLEDCFDVLPLCATIQEKVRPTDPPPSPHADVPPRRPRRCSSATAASSSARVSL